MRVAAILTLLVLSSVSNPALAAPDYQGIADDLRSGDAMRIGRAGRTLATLSHEERTAGAPLLAPAVIELFQHSHVGVRATALRMILMFRDGSVDIWTPVVALTADPEEGIRAIALETLGELCPEAEPDRLLPHLLVGLADPGWRTRASAATLAAKLAVPVDTLVPALTKALGDKNKTLARRAPEQYAETRRALVAALAKAGKKAAPAESALTDALKDRDAGVRAGAALALGRIGTVQARTAKALGTLLRDEAPEAAAAAAGALAEMPSLAVKELTSLIKALRHESAGVRAAAATALGAIGPEAKRAIDPLAKMAERDDDDVAKEAAKQALEKIR